MIKILIEQKDKSKEVQSFNSETEFRKAMNDFRKNGFEMLTKGWYYNPTTKETLHTSKYYFI